MENFGLSKDNIECHIYIIENDILKARITDYGATLVSLIDKKSNIDIVEGFDSVEGYIDKCQYMGATVGRVCNRIGKGTFKLNNVEYHVPINNNGNSLHGGEIGFDQKVFKLKDNTPTKLVFELNSPDNDQGYPGNLNLTVTYELVDNSLEFSYQASSDKDTLVNITNHSFFNLNGKGTALNHKIKINAQNFAHVDSNGLTLDEVENVKDTPFDFTSFKELGENIKDDNEQLRNGTGYDHHFLVDGSGMREFVVCKGDLLTMTIFSDTPGFHLYSSNFLDGCVGKYDEVYDARSSVCFETQYYPNAINYTSQIKPILKANQMITHKTKYIIEGENK